MSVDVYVYDDLNVDSLHAHVAILCFNHFFQ